MTAVRPASPIQQRIVLGAQLRPDDPSTNWALLTRLPDGVDLPHLAAAIESVLTANRTFADTFVIDDDLRVRARHEPRNHTIPITEFATREAMSAHAGAWGDTVFDPLSERLFHAELARVGSESFLLMAGSHAISDGFGFYQLTVDFGARYTDLAAPLDDISSPADHIDRPLHSQRDAIAHFAATLHGCEDLRIDGWGRRDSAGRIPGSITRHPLDASLHDRIGALAKTLGVRRYAVLAAACAVVAGTIAQSEDVVIATPMANRRTGPASTTRGVRVNTLPMRFQLGADVTLADLAISADHQIARLIDFEQHSFDEFARTVVSSDALDATTPSVLFTVYPQAMGVSIDGAPSEILHVNRRYLQQPLGLTVEVADTSVVLIVERADDLPPADIAAMYQHVLARCADHEGDLLIGEIDWHTPELTSVVADGIEFGPNDLVAGFSASTELFADEPAVVTDTETLTYAELDAASDAIAAWLNEIGAGPDIVVSMTPGCTHVSALMGILKSGRTYVPVDPAHLRPRLPAVAAQCVGGMALLDVEPTPELADHGIDVRRLPGSLPAARAPERSPAPDDTAYVIFTSGTTGTPKGVGISHRAAARWFPALDAATGIGRARWLMFHAISFDISLAEILGALMSGGAVCIPDPDTRRDPVRLADFACRHRVEVVSQTPTAFTAYAPELRRVESLARIMFCGERLDFASLGDFARHRPDVTLTNAYGITETVIYHTAYDIPAQPDRLPVSSVVGRPFPDMGMLVVDADRRILPRGVSGQVAVTGAGLMTGYRGIDRAAFTTINETPTYLTGDRGYLGPDGDFVILGRTDGQVKLRGHRCELAEIEYVCGTAHGVTAAHALVRGSGLDARLICFVGGQADPARVRAHAADRLPSYAVPDRVVVLESLPRNTNGKVDAKALADLPDDGPDTRTAIATPRVIDGSLAQAVADIWRDVLQTDDFDRTTRFFDAGGTSATLLQVKDQLHRRLGADVDAADLFEYCTPGALTEYLARRSPDRMEGGYQ